MVCQKLNILSFADKKQSRRSDRMTLGAFLMTYFTLRKCSFGHLAAGAEDGGPAHHQCGHQFAGNVKLQLPLFHSVLASL